MKMVVVNSSPDSTVAGCVITSYVAFVVTGCFAEVCGATVIVGPVVAVAVVMVVGVAVVMVVVNVDVIVVVAVGVIAAVPVLVAHDVVICPMVVAAVSAKTNVQNRFHSIGFDCIFIKYVNDVQFMSSKMSVKHLSRQFYVD